MSPFTQVNGPPRKRREVRSRLTLTKASLLALLLLTPLALQAQGSPFDTGFNALQTLFTGTVAKVASLIAIVIGVTASPTENPVQKRHWPASPPERALPFSR